MPAGDDNGIESRLGTIDNHVLTGIAASDSLDLSDDRLKGGAGRRF